MKGEWCQYVNRPLFCQEESGCLNCDVYYLTMPVPYDGRTVEDIETKQYPSMIPTWLQEFEKEADYFNRSCN